MRRLCFAGSAAACLLALASSTRAQQPEHPTRSLGAIVGTSSELLGNSATVRPLSNGQLLVHDPARRRVLLFDSNLQRAAIVADTTSQTANAYGHGLTGLVPFTGDSSLMTDVSTGTFVVLDPVGKIARIIRFNRTANRALTRLPSGGLAFDHAGHLLYRAPPPFYLSLLAPDFVGDTLMVGPDSVPILRAELATGHVDTLAMLEAPRARQAVTRRGQGLGGNGHPAFNPIPAGDDWTMLNDGTLAVVRVHDYRVERVRSDRHLVAGPVIHVPMVRIPNAMKVLLVAGLRAADSLAERSEPSPPGTPRFAVVEPGDLPDFQPRFTADAARGDADGNVWVHVNPAASPGLGLTYDVINPSGVLIDRVQFPDGSTLVGFGPGVAYLLMSANGGVHLAAAHIH